MKAELQRVLDWADKKLATGAEPPWAWYQYAKLREAVEEVIACLEATAPQMEGVPQVRTRQDGGLRLVVSNGVRTITATRK
jgi:hypothetical protein